MDAYSRYGPALVRKCERMLASREEAEDVVQSLFIDLIRKGQTDVTLPYLYRAATTRSLNRIRDVRRRAQLLDQYGGVTLGGVAAPPEARVLHLELLTRLVDELDDRSSQILVYRYLDLMEVQEIADLIGTSRKTVGNRLAQIRERLLALVGEA